jgi:SAM-dependent methyltransferase
MKEEYLSFLQCPKCFSELSVTSEITEGERIKQGTLTCKNDNCNAQYTIRNFVPRFVDYGYYAQSFGAQWKTFAKTQLDTEVSNDSELRFDSEVGWNEVDLTGKSIVEFGSGAGRFIDVVSKRGARLCVGIDITDAVDASQENLGNRDNVFFVQADFFSNPLKDSYFDFAYSIGVLHHTPEPEAAFKIMVNKTNDSGHVALGLYEISLYRRPNRNSLKISTIELFWALNLWRCELFRTMTTRLPEKMFLSYCKTVVPVLHYINKVPVIRFVRYLLPSTCYRNKPVDWSMVDTHDTYATKIVHQYRHKDVFQWFMRVNLHNIILHNGRAGWVSITATRCNTPLVSYDRYLHKQPGAPGVIAEL